MYAIIDNVTGEWLQNYRGPNKDEWTGEREPRNLMTYPTIEAAEKVVKELEYSFRKAGEDDIDFEVVRVKEIVYYERDI
jgi:hypothetical protein